MIFTSPRRDTTSTPSSSAVASSFQTGGQFHFGTGAVWDHQIRLVFCARGGFLSQYIPCSGRQVCYTFPILVRARCTQESRNLGSFDIAPSAPESRIHLHPPLIAFLFLFFFYYYFPFPSLRYCCVPFPLTWTPCGYHNG